MDQCLDMEDEQAYTNNMARWKRGATGYVICDEFSTALRIGNCAMGSIVPRATMAAERPGRGRDETPIRALVYGSGKSHCR